MKDIYLIFQKNTINDEEKGKQLREIFNELKNKDLNELRRIFNTDAFKLILTYINDCTTGIEKILLDIIELVAEKGVQKFYGQSDILFNDIQSSGLITKIEFLIKEKTEKEKEEKKYSIEAEQLIRIQIQIMKGREQNQQMIDIYIKVIDKNINNLLNLINKLKQNYNKGNKNELKNEEPERDLYQSAQLIRDVSLIRDKSHNIPDHIMKIITQRLCSLIHLNCPQDINCQLKINIPLFPTLLKLQNTVLQSIIEVSLNNKIFYKILVNEHQFILHLTHIINQFASQSQNDNKIIQNEIHNQQLQESSSSLSLIISSLDLLRNQIIINNNQQIIETPNLLNSLARLYSYKQSIHANQEQNEQAFQIRNRSRWCLNKIQQYGDIIAQVVLFTVGYARLLTITFSTAGGTGEQEDDGVLSGLNNIFVFLNQLHNGRKNNQYQLHNGRKNNQYKTSQPSFPPELDLAKSCEEQFEEEGGIEEVESQLINKRYIYCSKIKNYAEQVKREVFNFFSWEYFQRQFYYYW